MTDNEKIVVTRHAGLVEYLRKHGIIEEDCKILSHASEEDVKGKNVIGVLPYSLSCLADSFTEVSMKVPAELRGKELTLEEVESLNPVLTEYLVVKRVL